MTDDARDTGEPALTVSGCILVSVACAVALLIGPTVGGLNHGVGPAAGALLVSALSIGWGRALVPLLRLPARVPAYLVATVVGYGAASLVHLAATALLNLDASRALPLDLAVAAMALVVSMPRPGQWAAAEVQGLRRAAVDAGILLACAALATFWARETVTAVPAAMSTGVFPAWQDYFLHASEISYLRDYPSFERHSQYFSAVAQPLYHRGSYALPALMSQVSGLASLGLATAFWLPTGLLLCLCATYVFGTAVGGPLAGLGAVVAVFLVPDASTYGFENRFLSFHWLMQMAAGSGYALAPALVALSVLATSSPERRVRAVVTAGLLVFCAAAFRVHVAILAAGMLVWFVLLAWRPRVTRTGVATVLVAAGLVGGALRLMESIALAPHFLSGASHPVLFFLSIHSQASNQPTPYFDWMQSHGVVWNVAVGYGMMVVAGCGGWVAVLAAVWPSGVLSRMGWRVGALPVALLLSNLTVILFVPTPAHGDITDFGHRPFVLVYLVCGALAGAALAVLAREWFSRRPRSASVAGQADRGGAAAWPWFAVVLVALVGLSTPCRYGARVQQRWWPPYATIRITRDVLDAAEFVRTHSRPGEQVLAGSQDPEAVFVALTERRAYLSRVSLYRLLGGPFAAELQARIDAHASVDSVSSFDELKSLGGAIGVSWYIADTPASLSWPASERARCAYCSDTVRVYDLR